MLKSTNIGELVKAIAGAQSDYKALVATHKANIPGKDGKAGYAYTYADLNDGLDALQGTLNSRGVAVIQEAYTVDRGVEVVTMLALGEQWMESKPLFMPVSGAAQAVGSAITYGRRYSLFPMVGLAPADDDGAEANRNAPEPSRMSKPRASKQPAEPPSAPPDGDEGPGLRGIDIGPRCTGKAAGIAKGIGERMRTLVTIRKSKASELWADVLAEAGIDVTKYGPTLPRSEALTIADGTTVREYLVRVLDETTELEAPGDTDSLHTECSKLWVQLCKSDPGFHLDDFALDWAAAAKVSDWPAKPTVKHYAMARDWMASMLEKINS